MRCRLLQIVLGVTCWLWCHPTGVAAAPQTCATCHAGLTLSVDRGHSFTEWQRSTHAKNGVGCADCHGGNAAATDAAQAHVGVVSSREANSSVYFQNVPATCGRCHEAEYREFRKSAHHTMLQKSGRGPNCLTCHGAMSTRVLRYEEMEQTCSLCHGKPTEAAKALSAMEAAGRAIALYQTAIGKLGREAAAPYAARVQAFTTRQRVLQQIWHSFNVGAVVGEAQRLVRDVNQAERDLPPQPKKGP